MIENNVLCEICDWEAEKEKENENKKKKWRGPTGEMMEMEGAEGVQMLSLICTGENVPVQ
jgi:hypothetical protein